MQDIRSFHGYSTLCHRLKHPPHEALMERYIAAFDRPRNHSTIGCPHFLYTHMTTRTLDPRRRHLLLHSLGVYLVVQITMWTILKVQLVTRYLVSYGLPRHRTKLSSCGNWRRIERHVAFEARVSVWIN
jgi:hypothetical protein